MRRASSMLHLGDVADRARFLLLLLDRRHHAQNQGHRMSGIDVHRPCLCQRHHRHCSLDKFSRHCSLEKFSCVSAYLESSEGPALFHVQRMGPSSIAKSTNLTGKDGACRAAPPSPLGSVPADASHSFMSRIAFSADAWDL